MLSADIAKWLFCLMTAATLFHLSHILSVEIVPSGTDPTDYAAAAATITANGTTKSLLNGTSTISATTTSSKPARDQVSRNLNSYLMLMFAFIFAAVGILYAAFYCE